MLRLVITGLVLCLASTALAAEIIGRASVIDGDTIEIRGQRIRLYGIDAPESAQECSRDDRRWRCGAAAANALADFLAARTVTCASVDKDRYGRVVARCTVAGTSINSWLVRQGWALDYTRYSKGEFAAVEKAARTDRTGVWAGEIQAPWEWRASRR